ncbi:hypothetical protein V2J09_020013 [Rumex salicifolius]
MMTWSLASPGLSVVGISSNSCPSFLCSSSSRLKLAGFQRSHHYKLPTSTNPWPESLNSSFSSRRMQICRAAEYKFPDPIPEFAEAETEKFKSYLLKKLGKKEDIFGDSLDEVIGICTEIFSTFMHTEYGGPGTLLVIPFIDMADTLEERDLPGGPQAARSAIKWAQDHVDKDWKEWTQGATN